MWQSVWLSVLSCGSVCRSCVTVIARPASTHTALVSQSLVGLCFAFPSINQANKYPLFCTYLLLAYWEKKERFPSPGWGAFFFWGEDLKDQKNF